jgi:hypothetical protein
MKGRDDHDEPRPGEDPGSALQTRIDESLLRHFSPPADLDAEGIVERARAIAADAAVPKGSLLDWWPLAGIAAACLALLLHRLHEAGTHEAGSDAPRSPVEIAGTLEPAPDLVYPGEIGTPDLGVIYAEIVEASLGLDEREIRCDPAEWSDDEDLAAALARRFGQRPKLRSGASHRLQGPFRSSQWPTGVVLAGFPRGSTDRRPAVLVAEHVDHHRCCVHLCEPEDGELHIFTWRVGRLFLTEITPFPEPRLIEYFEEGP